MKPLILFPFNGNAREAVAVVEAINAVCPGWDILGFADDDPETHHLEFAGYRVLGGRNIIARYEAAFVLAVPGRPENFRSRNHTIQNLRVPAERFATLVHPAAAIGPEISIGWNTLIMAHVTVTGGAAIGSHVVILPGTVVSHDVHVCDYCLIGSNTVLSGGVRVKEGCYIGSGSRLIQEITVGPNALIGLGSVVIRDVPARTTVAGCPARMLRKQ